MGFGKKQKINEIWKNKEARGFKIVLRQDAEFMNSSLSAVERSVKFFKVVGGRCERRIACFPIKWLNASDVGAQ